MNVRIYNNARVLIEDGDRKWDITYGDGYDVSAVIELAMNPRLYMDGDIDGEVYHAIKNEGVIEKCITDRVRGEKLKKFVSGNFVDPREFLMYGKWRVDELALSAGLHNRETLPVTYSIGDTHLINDLASRKIWEMVNSRQWQYLLPMKVHTLADLLYPMYHRKVKNVDEWFYGSLLEVLDDAYSRALLSHMDMLQDYIHDRYFTMVLMNITTPAEVFMNKVLLMSYYAPDQRKFWKLVTNRLMEKMMDPEPMMGMSDRELKWLGKFRGTLHDFIVEMNGGARVLA